MPCLSFPKNVETQPATSASPGPGLISQWREQLRIAFETAEERRLKRLKFLSILSHEAGREITEANEQLSVNKSWLDREPHLVELQPDMFSSSVEFSERIDKNLCEIQRMVEDQGAGLGESEWFSWVDGTLAIFVESQRPKLDAASLPLANLRGAKLAGASMIGANLQGADLETADLRCADLRGANLALANLAHADLRGALLGPPPAEYKLESADLRGANLSEAQLAFAWCWGFELSGCEINSSCLDGAYMAEAGMTGMRLLFCSVEKVNLARARMQHTHLMNCRFNGAKFQSADLSHVVIEEDLWFAGGELDGATWELSGAPRLGNVIVEGKKFGAPSKPKGRPKTGNLRRLVTMLFFGDGDEEEEEEEDDEDDEDEEDEMEQAGNQEEEQSKEVSEDQEGKNEDGGCSMPLMDTVIEDAVVTAADHAEAIAAQKLQAAVERAKAQIAKLIQLADDVAKPQAEALQKLLVSKTFLKLSKLKPETMTKIAELVSSTKSGQKVSKVMEHVRNQLKSVQHSGVAPLLRNLADSQLSARTGYSSGQLLRIFRVSAIQMARDVRELHKLQTYLDKLQETVNENNWDDVTASFTYFYALQAHLQGERSQQIFQLIWKEELFRSWIMVADLFAQVVPVNHPPAAIIHNVKNAVKYIKEHAETWEKAIAKETAAIELTRTRQSQFFALLVSAISGLFMYIATFLSSVTFQAYQDGRLRIPYLSG